MTTRLMLRVNLLNVLMQRGILMPVEASMMTGSGCQLPEQVLEELPNSLKSTMEISFQKTTQTLTR